MASGGDTNTESVADFGFALYSLLGGILCQVRYISYTGRERLFDVSSARFMLIKWKFELTVHFKHEILGK